MFGVLWILYGKTGKRRKLVKYGRNVILVLLVLALAFNVMGCSRLIGPSDEEVIKAIEDSGLLKSGGFTVTPPIVIVEKGKREQDGAWPVKVRLKLTVKMTNGQTKHMDTTSQLRIFKDKDLTGKTVWKASM
jgi:hypothetical protein